jgi:hypothetical protein
MIRRQKQEHYRQQNIEQYNFKNKTKFCKRWCGVTDVWLEEDRTMEQRYVRFIMSKDMV